MDFALRMLNVPKSKTVDVNRPFMLAVINKRTDYSVFIGKVAYPQTDSYLNKNVNF